MVFTKNMILVCGGGDTRSACTSGLPLLQLCLSVTAQGTLRRTQASADCEQLMLGLAELPEHIERFQADRLAQDLTYEAERVHAIGLFADIETATPYSSALLHALDLSLHDAGITLYVPYAMRNAVQYAVLTVDTAVFSGSLVERVSSLQGTYNTGRIAAFLKPVSNDFVLPSQDERGALRSVSERCALLQRYNASVFFSRELCAKYFTYTDETGDSHFLLFDDCTTLAAKLAQLSGCGVQTVFALYPDAAGLLKL